tara:strand:+ start:382 stop:1398 length:1017 start_codon:yes stop_codon:yes gene_type:complete
MDGVISDKEREVIFRKSKELGVPEDECEIILEGMIQQKGGEVQSKEVSVQTNIPVPNSFEEKKPELIKRKTLNKQPELESSISKNDSKYIEIEKQKEEFLLINSGFFSSELLVEFREEQTKLKSENELKYRIILNEKLLNNLPNQTYGSVIFYNELNKNSTFFENSHLNKITRFLNFIETHEDKYLGIYDRCVGLYIDDPNNNCFNELINKLETINHYYEIMKSLIHNVNKDKVLYNKLYNLIEDEGIFMTKTEKESLNYMKKVSTGIISLNNNIVDGFSKLETEIISLNKNITDGFSKLETEISMVSSVLYDLDSSLWMISSSLDDIYMNLPDNRRR